MLPWIKLVALAGLLGAAAGPASAALWDEEPAGARGNVEGRVYRADGAELRRRLALAPDEGRGDRSQVIELPLPDGGLARFSLVESPIMEAALAERYPGIETYRLIGIDDPGASGRAMMSGRGFSAMLHTAAGRVLIDPLARRDDGYRVGSRYRRRAAPVGINLREPLRPAQDELAALAALPAARVSGSVIRYRLAVAATDNFVDAVGGTVAAAQAEIVNTINRVNSIYERDLGIRLVLVGNNDRLIERKDADGNDTGCLINNDPFAILVQNQQWIDHILDSSRYDVGHVFTTDPGGLASLRSVCVAGIKAQGTSGHPTAGADDFYIDIVAHEIGHQLGADHSFNGTTGACSGNRNDSTAFEPGSGSTIMSYAGLCSGESLQIFSDATFHAGSIEQIDAVVGSTGMCYTTVASGNIDPQVTAAADYTIPALTPFRLDNPGGSDADLDTLSYQWDQMNAGTETNSTSFGRDNGSNALFRSYLPRADSWRNFPALGTQLLGRYDRAEVLPCSDRALAFRLTARDNAGGQATDDVTVDVVDTGRAFEITSHRSAQTVISAVDNSLAVTWDVADTNLNTVQVPINCTAVDIDLLAFSGAGFTTYSVHNLASGTANDGSETVFIADTTLDADVARLRVSCSDNIFYDISDANLVIDGIGTTPFDNDDLATYFNANLANTESPGAPVCAAPRPAAAVAAPGASTLIDPFAPPAAPRLAANGCELPTPIAGGKKDSSSLSPAWLLALLVAVGGIRLGRRFPPGRVRPARE